MSKHAAERPAPKPLTLVFAGTFAQARNWAVNEGLGPRDFFYVRDGDALRGRSTRLLPRVVVGTFHSRPDADLLLQQLVVTDHWPRPTTADLADKL
jgi:hypothetical protein